MKCGKCGAEVGGSDAFCGKCGEKVMPKAVVVKDSNKAPKGYSENGMCPFTVAETGGTNAVGFVFGINAQSYTWGHMPCINRYCKMWDEDKSDCSIKLGMSALYKKTK